ncbi:hypothetical protein [Vibrio sp. PID17_43]|uniref:hypothetical protein n=1 Tax=Vibrio sp. PID17_43 TaxID=1583451 RepID=UPI000BFFCF46|nr:hypothetical protein [Vibrio sp. PID17_43]PHJ40009.1 hypothetical protein AK965_19250 [Vibrio sp. PID17_43]
MNISRALLFVTLTVTTFASSANTNQLLGVWKCSTSLPVSWLDAVSIYSPDGKFKGVAHSITEADSHRNTVEFDLFIDGSWSLNGDVLTTNITSVEVIPKNSKAEKELNVIKEAVNQPSLLHSEQEVLQLNNDTLVTRNKDGVVDNCNRAISAFKLKEQS